MSISYIATNHELQHQVEQFYYHEARLLDNRQYQQWLALCHPDICYIMPSRTNPMVDNRQHGKESMISVERELEDIDSDGCPIRNETYPYLALRVERSYKINSWSENPPARTRRIIGNVEIIGLEGNHLIVLNNFHLFYSRPGSANFIYAGQRRDTLVRHNNDFTIIKRTIVMDIANIELPTLGLFL